MSLMRTLGKIAMGVVVAKGMGKMMNNRQSGSTGSGSTGSSGGLGGMLGSALGGGRSSGGSGGLGDMLGKVLGGQSGGNSGSGGLGSMLGGKGGGMGDLGALLGGRSAGGTKPSGGMAGGLGGLLESLGGGGTRVGANQTETPPPRGGSFGDMLNSSLRDDAMSEPKQEDEEHARLLITAMINAAKSDGNIDQEEKKKIVAHLDDDLTEEDKRFVLHEMQTPLDADAFIQSVPAGRAEEVYLMSLMAIDLDHPDEAKYLDKLRSGLNMSESTADAIHEKLGVPTLYS